MDILAAITNLLRTPKHIVITVHARPDADALGAALGLAAFLRQQKHSVSVVSPTPYPNFLSWLPGMDGVIVYDRARPTPVLQSIQQADVIFCVDFSLLQRLNTLGEVVDKARAVKVVIDHHLDKVNFTDLVLCSSHAAAAAELVYQLIKTLADENTRINKEIATCLYTGIMTDTGSFKNPNTTPQTHRITADLMEFGVDVPKIHRIMYDNNTLNRLQFISFAIAERLVVLPEYHTAYFAIRASDTQRFKLAMGDTEGLVNYTLSMRGIILGTLMSEKAEAVRLSLRSIGDFPVDVMARTHFGGGGHKNAAGGSSALSLEATVAKFEGCVSASKETLVKNYRTYGI